MRKKYRAKITASGYIYILITVVLSVSAANTGNNLLYLIASLMLGIMLLSGISSLANLLFLDLEIIPPKEIFAEVPAKFDLKVRKSRGSSFFLSCETPLGTARIPFAKGESTVPIWLIFPKRGLARIEDLRIHSGFPLGFFRRFKAWSLDLDALVFPRPMSVGLPPLTGRAFGGERSGGIWGELGDEIKELRNYKTSDPLKWVDWKATARKGTLVTREFYRLVGDTLTIDLSRGRGGWEKRLSEACYLVLEGCRRRLSVGLLLPEKEIEAGWGEDHRRRLLDAIAKAKVR